MEKAKRGPGKHGSGQRSQRTTSETKTRRNLGISKDQLVLKCAPLVELVIKEMDLHAACKQVLATKNTQETQEARIARLERQVPSSTTALWSANEPSPRRDSAHLAVTADCGITLGISRHASCPKRAPTDQANG